MGSRFQMKRYYKAFDRSSGRAVRCRCVPFAPPGQPGRHSTGEMTRREHDSQPTRTINDLVAVFSCAMLLVTGCTWSAGERNADRTSAVSALESLLLEGDELHASLRTREPDSLRDLPTNEALTRNPILSNDVEFVEAISRGGSQGRLGREGIRRALYARYETGENEIGIYGLEAKSNAVANEREKAIREIWAYNASLDRASVHRQGLVLVVIWNDGVSPECWESANARVEERLNVTGSL